MSIGRAGTTLESKMKRYIGKQLWLPAKRSLAADLLQFDLRLCGIISFEKVEIFPCPIWGLSEILSNAAERGFGLDFAALLKNSLKLSLATIWISDLREAPGTPFRTHPRKWIFSQACKQLNRDSSSGWKVPDFSWRMPSPPRSRPLRF